MPVTNMRSENHVLAQTVESLHQGLGDDLIAVILFGSRARGDAHEGSDWDLFVHAEGLPSCRFDRHLFLVPLLPLSYGGAISVVARTPAEFEKDVCSLYLDIALDGRILYDPYQYAARRMKMLRRIIDRLGLYRERMPAGDIWRWKVEPKWPWVIEWEQGRDAEP